MNDNSSAGKWKQNSRAALAIFGLLMLLAFGFSSKEPFHSSEYRFSDNTSHGLAIMPASCPSDPHYSGDCSDNPTCPAGFTYDPASGECVGSCPAGTTEVGGRCVPTSCRGYYCQGNDLYYEHASGDRCVWNKVQTCAYGCSGAACLPPPAPQIEIHARPSIVSAGDTSNISWSSHYTTSCTVSGDNGDSWTGLTGEQVSKPIVRQTIYTLVCDGVDGSSKSASVTINIIPNWQEPCSQGFHHDTTGKCVPD